MPRRTTVLLALALAAIAALSAAAPLEPGRTRVMSFNIRYGTAEDGDDVWENRRFLVRLTIRDAAPDLIGLQECLAFQADELDEAFRDFALVGVGRDDGEQGGEMCAIMYRWSRFELLDQGTFWLSETPEQPGRKGWDAACPRIVTWVQLADRFCEPDTFVFASTHLDHLGPQARREGARLIRSGLEEIADGLPILLAGDFNAGGGPGASEPWDVLAGDGVWRDTWLEAGGEAGPLGDGTFHGFDGVPDTGRIDWILCTGGWEVEAAAIVRTERRGRWPSDHHPVTADFTLGWRPGVDVLDAVTGATPRY